MDLVKRNNVQVLGDAEKTMVLAHGFGCDQNMWRYLTSQFSADYRLVLFDLVGAGLSDHTAYDRQKYSTLQGYATDLLEIIEEYGQGSVILISHSVSAMIGLVATIQAPQLFSSHIMVSPSPSYINDEGYIGGFDQADIDELVKTIENNYLGWSSSMAPAIMGAPDQPALGVELSNSFCKTNPDIAKHFAKVTFMSDHRHELPKSVTPTLILQCSDDFIAPISVGVYMENAMPHAKMHLIENTGHCPHLSAPQATGEAIRVFLQDHVPMPALA